MGRERIKDLVSVVITNYNYSKYIEQALDSILNQSYPKIEIIIVDDNSDDGSPLVIRNWIKENKGKIDGKGYTLEFIHLPRNLGFVDASNIGLFTAKGEFIAIQDGDDYSHERRIELQYEYLKENIDIVAVGTDYLVFTDEYETPKKIPNYIKFGVEVIRENLVRGNSAVCYSTLMFQGAIFDKLGGLTGQKIGAEDFTFVSKLMSSGINNIKNTLYNYRVHQNQRAKQFYGSNNKKRVKVSTEQLKLLLVLDRFNLGGTETHVISLVKGFLRRGIKVVILADDGPLGKEFRKLDCKIYNMKFPYCIAKDEATIRSYKQKISQIILAEDINIMHCHQSPSGFLSIETGHELNIPVVFTVHGLYYDDIVNTSLNKSNAIISVSHPTFEWLLRYSLESKLIPNGVIFDEYKDRGNRKEIRDKFQISENAVVAMYCSRLAWGKIKTCENLIRVVRDLTRLENFDIHALIVGDGPGYEDISNIASRVNNLIGKNIIHMIGAATEVVDYYNASDCIVGTGRVAIEGMAAKKPIVATGNSGYIGLITKDNFEEAWIHYFGDHKSEKINNASYLYEDLIYLYKNKGVIEELGNDSYVLAKELFDIDTIIEQILDIYENSF